MSFTGTLDKCKACDKTVYFVDLLSADGVTYHKACFKCSHCKGTLVVRVSILLHHLISSITIIFIQPVYNNLYFCSHQHNIFFFM
ncbi:putative transcription factor interactor and regulator LIM family [Helianthus anomalus]